MNITLRNHDGWDIYSGFAALPPKYAPRQYDLTARHGGYTLSYQNVDGLDTPVGVFDMFSDGTARGDVLGLPASICIHRNGTATITIGRRDAPVIAVRDDERTEAA